MFRPGLNVRCRPRLGTEIVAHNSGSVELENVPIRGPLEGFQQWPHPKGLKLERGVPEATTRVREALLVVVAPEDLRRQQPGAMHMAVPSLNPASIKQSMSSHTSDSRARNSMEDTESSADLGGSSKISTMSDGDSVNISENQHLMRMTGGSMAAESEMVAKETETKVRHGSGLMLEENEGENEVDEDVNISPESPARDSDLETHSIQREPESGATTWTDDKHSSFLNSMEATFVRSLYGQQGLNHVGVHGHPALINDSEQDCVESRPVDAHGCCTSLPTELFELVQGGQEHQKPYYRPHGLDSSLATTKKAVLSNPWVRHFKQRSWNSEYVSHHPSTCLPAVIATPVKEVTLAVDVSQVIPHSFEKDQSIMGTTTKSSDVEEKQRSGASEDFDNDEIQNSVEVAESGQGFRLWQNRLQAGGQMVSNSSSRKDTASWMPKRSSTFDAGNADVLVNKRIKTTQQELAQKDLEMLEQYVAKQRAEGVSAADEHSEQAILEYVHKVIQTCVEEAGPSLASDQKETPKAAGRSAMDQVVPLLGRMDSYESRSSLSFPDLNAPSHLSTAVITEPGSEGRGRRTLFSLVPDLNAPVRICVPSSYTTNQPTINFTKDGEAVAKPWSPRSEIVSMEERYFHELAGVTHQPFEDDHGRNLSLELQTKGAAGGANEAFEGEPQLSPISNSRTWTWGLGGFRRRLHDHSVVAVPASSQPSRSLRDGIHFSDPVPFRSSGQHV